MYSKRMIPQKNRIGSQQQEPLHTKLREPKAPTRGSPFLTYQQEAAMKTRLKIVRTECRWKYSKKTLWYRKLGQMALHLSQNCSSHARCVLSLVYKQRAGNWWTKSNN
eukprot:691858-Hanusia_phi.AAC.5